MRIGSHLLATLWLLTVATTVRAQAEPDSAASPAPVQQLDLVSAIAAPSHGPRPVASSGTYGALRDSYLQAMEMPEHQGDLRWVLSAPIPHGGNPQANGDGVVQASAEFASHATGTSDAHNAFGVSAALGEPCDDGADGAAGNGFFDVVRQYTSRFYGRAEALALTRTSNNAARLAVRSGSPDTVLFSTGDLGFQMEFGYRATLGLDLEGQVAAEVTYFENRALGAGDGVKGNNNISLPGIIGSVTGGDFDAADEMTFSYEINLRNYEFNGLIQTVYNDTWLLVGARYVMIDDRVRIRSVDVDSGTSDFKVDSQSRLLGGQAGIIHRVVIDRFILEGIGKAGAYHNDASQSNVVRDFDNTFLLRDAAGSGSNVGVVGDINLNLTWIATPKLKLRVGYNVLWFTEVAQGPDQLDYTHTPASGTSLRLSSLFLHGVNAGVEGRF